MGLKELIGEATVYDKKRSLKTRIQRAGLEPLRYDSRLASLDRHSSIYRK